jgi:hypothetical protein
MIPVSLLREGVGSVWGPTRAPLETFAGALWETMAAYGAPARRGDQRRRLARRWVVTGGRGGGHYAYALTQKGREYLYYRLRGHAA